MNSTRLLMSYKVCVVSWLDFIEICCACAVQTTQTTQHQSAESLMSSNSSPIYQKSTKYSHLMSYTPLCILYYILHISFKITTRDTQRMSQESISNLKTSLLAKRRFHTDGFLHSDVWTWVEEERWSHQGHFAAVALVIQAECYTAWLPAAVSKTWCSLLQYCTIVAIAMTPRRLSKTQ